MHGRQNIKLNESSYMFMYSYGCVSCLCIIIVTYALFYPDRGFSVLFSSVVRQMPGYGSQRRGTVRTLPN